MKNGDHRMNFRDNLISKSLVLCLFVCWWVCLFVFVAIFDKNKAHIPMVNKFQALHACVFRQPKS